MITDNLFERILVEPVRNGANQLYIVSGYATAAMASTHLYTIQKVNTDISISLIVGMSNQDGLSESNHRGLQNLMESADNFQCSYIVNSPPVHSKVYAWFRDDHPVQGFLGSANYTQIAFHNRLRKEAMEESDASSGREYFKSLIDDTIYCTHPDTDNLIRIYNDRYYKRVKEGKSEIPEDDTLTPKSVIEGLDSVKISLITRQGNVPERSGLNWGQRPGRNPNQAYLSLSAEIYKTKFFPDLAIQFTVLTDDGKTLICSRAQQNGKAIHTPQNNSQLGEYFRNRLGLASGAKVALNDLMKYGRTNVDFYKIDDETYYMDFSV